MASVWLVALIGCGGSPECGPEQCAEACAAAAAPVVDPDAPKITPEEQAVLDWTLGEVRSGVRPWNEDDAVGTCRGRKGCDKFLGTDAGKLGRGVHFVRADLRVPPGPPGTFKVHFSTDCATPTGESKAFERDYDVAYGGPDQPYHLVLRQIDSPSEEGSQKCSWTLVLPQPTGDRTYTGGWEVLGK
ncbi:MAG: hypothetical protein ABMB14_11635 [Myxococcota bacterium]